MILDDRQVSKGIAMAPFPMNDIFEFLKSEESIYKLNYEVVERKILDKEEERDYIVTYTRYKGFWPISDR